jgi:Holliday junction resolvase RusA-like endonuclease
VSFRVVILGPPPSVNDSYQIVYHGPRCPTCGRGQPRLGKKNKVETWQDATAWQVKAARPSRWEPGRRVRIKIAVWFNRAGRDADDILKSLLDAIAVGLGVNDSIFLPAFESSEVDRANPRVEVEIENEVR